MKNLFLMLAASCLVSVFNSAIAQVSLDVEGGYIFSVPYNVVRIPAAGGSKFDLANDLDANTTFAFRARVNVMLGDRHILSALYAPLQIRSQGRIDRDIRYSDATFAGNTMLRATYKFNSYRLTYRYMLITKEHLKLGFGITAKVREANISLRNSDAQSDFPDLGFVPLVNFYIAWFPNEKFTLLLEGDALGTGKGRAEDIFGGVTYAITDRARVKAGYRILEGGADVERNYNFSCFNYAVAGVIVDLGRKTRQ